MKLKNLSALLLSGIIITIITSCSMPSYKNLWQTNNIMTDSKSDSDPLRFYDSDSKLQYTISNDFDNLYIHIKATDEMSQRKIIRAGMQIWIDTTGKKAQNIGILYPMAGKEKFNRNNINEKSFHVKNLKEQFPFEFSEMVLTGFKSPVVSGISPVKNNFGIEANIDWDASNTMIYKAVIPFKTFYKDKITLTDSAKIIGLSIVINAVTVPEKHTGEDNGGMNGGARSMGMGGAGNGGMGSGGMGRGMGAHHISSNGNNNMTEPNEIKFKISLATKK